MIVAKHNTKVKNVNNMKDLETTLGLKSEQIQDLMKRTRKNLDNFAKAVKNGELDSLLGISEMNMKYLVKQTGKNADEITDWLKRNDIELKNIKPKNVDDIIKGVSGADDVYANKGYATGEDWNNYFKNKYGNANVQWDTAVNFIDDILDMPSITTRLHPEQLADLAKKSGWKVEPLGKGSKAGLTYDQGGGYSMRAPNGASEYI